jgi:hypothetical protein
VEEKAYEAPEAQAQEDEAEVQVGELPHIEPAAEAELTARLLSQDEQRTSAAHCAAPCCGMITCNMLLLRLCFQHTTSPTLTGISGIQLAATAIILLLLSA